ncbi:MAG TPA: alpha/beta hydrolase, partial [bacterium]|nr:alpha/beta hydrolase [bacterium]
MDHPQLTLAEVKAEILRRAGRINPFEHVEKTEVEEVLSGLNSLEPDHWASQWGKMGARYEAKGEVLAGQAHAQEAGEALYRAYEYYRIARYPVPSSPGKMEAYRSAVRNYLKAAPTLTPPVRRVEIPFEESKVVGYLQIPEGTVRPPVVLHWGGVD